MSWIVDLLFHSSSLKQLSLFLPERQIVWINQSGRTDGIDSLIQLWPLLRHTLSTNQGMSYLPICLIEARTKQLIDCCRNALNQPFLSLLSKEVKSKRTQKKVEQLLNLNNAFLFTTLSSNFHSRYPEDKDRGNSMIRFHFQVLAWLSTG